MKTTIDLPEPLLDAAKRTAEREGTTLRALVETGLRRVLAERHEKEHGFRLRDASFRGEGLQAGVVEGRWEPLRDAIYEGRGA